MGDPLSDLFRGSLSRIALTLQQIINRVGKTHLDLSKVTGWLTETASEFKLRRDDAGGGLGTFGALETLTLAFGANSHSWNALPLIGRVDSRVPGFDYLGLAARAEDWAL